MESSGQTMGRLGRRQLEDLGPFVRDEINTIKGYRKLPFLPKLSLMGIGGILAFSCHSRTSDGLCIGC